MSGSRPVTPKLPKQKCPAALLRDLRGVAAFRALEIVYQKHDSVKDDVKHTLMGDYFHGDEATGTLSTVKKLCGGKEAFQFLFEFEPTPSGTAIYTKQHISADGITYLVNGDSINGEILSRSRFTKQDGDKVTGRTLYDNASKVILANCKKAQSLVPKLVNKAIYLAEDGTISRYHSGLNEERFLQYINDGMYVLLNKKSPGKGNDGEVGSNAGGPNDASNAVVLEDSVADILGDDSFGVDVNVDGDATSEMDANNLSLGDIADAAAGVDSFKWDDSWMPFGEKAPLGYRFPGYCAYACFGPHTNFFSNLINPQGNSDKDKSKQNTGRSHQRQEEAKRAKLARENGANRGLTMDSKIKLASLAQQDESNAQRDKETRLLALKVAIKTLEDTRKSKETLLSIDSVSSEMKTNLVTEIIDLNNQILKRNEEMLQFTKDNRGKGTRVASAVLKEAEERMGIAEDDEVEVLE